MEALLAIIMLTSPAWAVVIGYAVINRWPRYFDLLGERMAPHREHRAFLDSLLVDHNSEPEHVDTNVSTLEDPSTLAYNRSLSQGETS